MTTQTESQAPLKPSKGVVATQDDKEKYPVRMCGTTQLINHSGTKFGEVPIGAVIAFDRAMPLWLGTEHFHHMGVHLGTGADVLRMTKVTADFNNQPIEPDEHYICHLWHPDAKSGAVVRVDKIALVGEGSPIYHIKLPHLKEPETEKEVVDRAMSRLAEPGFHAVTKSCSHFATWAHYGEAVNVDWGSGLGGLVAPTIAIAGAGASLAILPFAASAALVTGAGAAAAAGAAWLGSAVHKELYVPRVTRSEVDFPTPGKAQQGFWEQMCA